MFRIALAALVCLLLGNVDDAADPSSTPPPAKAALTAPPIEHPALDAHQAVACKAQIRWAARVKLWTGGLTRSQFVTVQAALDNPDAMTEISEQIAYSMQQEAQLTKAKPKFDPAGFFQWIIEHWDVIWAMIQQIIAVLSQAESPHEALARGPAADHETFFVTWPGPGRATQTCTPETCPTNEPPEQPQANACQQGAPMFSPASGPFMQRGPARRFLVRLLRPRCRS